MKIPINKIEEVTGKKVRKNYTVLGADIASRTGICLMKSDKENVYLKYQYVEFDKTTPKAKYKSMVNTFEDIINSDIDKAIIEDTHLKFFKNPVTKKLQPQVSVLKQLTRYGAYAISRCIRESVTYEIIGATKSRANFNIKTKKGGAKQSIALWLKDKLDIDLNGDNDCSDAIILALNGIIK